MASWRDIVVPKGFDLAPRNEHPLNVQLPNHQLQDSGVQKRLAREPFKAFNPTKDPIFFFLHRSEMKEDQDKKEVAANMFEWVQIAVFDSGLVVLPKNPDLPKERILEDISFVIDRRHAWPLHWCLNTPLVEIAIGWEQGLESPKLPKEFPDLVRREPGSAAEIVWYTPYSSEGIFLQEPTLPGCQYYPIEDQKVFLAEIAANPSILLQWVAKSVFIKLTSPKNQSPIIQATIARLLTWAEERVDPFLGFHGNAPIAVPRSKEEVDAQVVGIRAFQFFPGSETCTIRDFRWTGQPSKDFEWIAPAGTIPPKEKELWTRKEPLYVDEEERESTSAQMDVDNEYII